MMKQNGSAQAPTAVKVVEMVGESTESWEDAARLLVSQASQTVRNITGLDVIRSTAVVVDGRITEYRVTANLAIVEEPAILVG